MKIIPPWLFWVLAVPVILVMVAFIVGGFALISAFLVGATR